MQKFGVKDESIQDNKTIVARPIRYLTTTVKPGYIAQPFADTILIIIALSRLSQDNGLPRQDPSITLEPGQDIILSGDTPQTFDGQGGGIAYLMVLKKVSG